MKAPVTEILSRSLARLKKDHPQTSIRGIAARLSVTPSYLSKIFRGERDLSPALLAKLARILRLDRHEVAEIQRLMLDRIEVELLSSRTGLRTLKSKKAVAMDYQSLGKGDFWLLEKWYHLAILNLVTTENFDSQTIAIRLGITEEQAEKSLLASVDAGYLKRSPNGQVARSQMKIRFPVERSHPAIRKFHSLMLQKALEVLKHQPSDQEYDRRLISGISFACNPEQLSQAKLILEDAVYKAVDLLTTGPCTEVFQINLQLFPLAK